ncbi:hypothetical protein VQ042_13705 [Aurantimonas sp. A2-1-M11]|uniref:hypothetical protein n=1 Tax=Aurantimonas sp. A2-1-M11 TaxID=3113712 RepID=UPI002F94F1A0
MPVIGRTVMIVGSPGAGKSTLARRIGASHGLRVIHMDQLYWTAGWRKREPTLQLALVEDAVAEPGWVFDGNHTATMPIRTQKADTLIWLDLPRRLCVLRILRRIAGSYGQVRPDMAAGCPERFDADFLRWAWTFPQHSGPGLARLYAAFSGRKYRLTTPRAVAAFVTELGGCHGGAA